MFIFAMSSIFVGKGISIFLNWIEVIVLPERIFARWF